MLIQYITLSSHRHGGRLSTLGVLTVRNVDDDVIVALKARAKANHRSLEGELRYLLGRYALPSPALGVVRERARMAAAFKATPTVRSATSDMAEEAADTCLDVRADDTEWMGAMRDVGEIVGDIVSPAADLSDWDALRPEMVHPKDVDSS